MLSSLLLLQQQDQDAPSLEETLCLLLLLLLHACPAFHPVILRTIWRNLQAIASNEGGFREVKLVRTVARPDEVQLLLYLLCHI